jgi:hypothetical protein
MVTHRRATQEAHERAKVKRLVDELNRRHRSNYKVVATPNPPEAIIETHGRKSWIELVTVFMNRRAAEDEWTFATPGNRHKPAPDEVLIEPDAQFARSFAHEVRKKLEKTSYVPVREQYGPGYLAVSIQYELFDLATIRAMRKEWQATGIRDLGCFRSIYLIVWLGGRSLLSG